MMPPRPAAVGRVVLLALFALTLSACVAASDGRQAALSVSSNDLPPIPICRNEMLAYVELTRLAKLYGENWEIFSPAVDALKQQILECLDDHTGGSDYHMLSARLR